MDLQLQAPVWLDRDSRGRGAEAHARALSDRLLSTGIAVAAVGVVVQTASHLFQAFVAPSLDELSADRDDNAFAWASAVAMFAGAVAAFVLYALQRRRGLLALAVLLAFLSLDDIATVHETIGSRSESVLGLASYAGRIVWIVLYLPLLVLGVVLLVRLALEASPRARRVILVGLGLLGAGVAAEAATYLTYAAGYGEGTTLDTLEVAVEEGAELAGWILIGAALVAHACATLLTAGRIDSSGRPGPGRETA